MNDNKLKKTKILTNQIFGCKNSKPKTVKTLDDKIYILKNFKKCFTQAITNWKFKNGSLFANSTFFQL